MRPDLRVLLTTGTVTSAALAVAPARRPGYPSVRAARCSGLREAVFSTHWQPDLVVFTESEIWPNLIVEAADRKVPIALVNARMSGRSFVRWRGPAPSRGRCSRGSTSCWPRTRSSVAHSPISARVRCCRPETSKSIHRRRPSTPSSSSASSGRWRGAVLLSRQARTQAKRRSWPRRIASWRGPFQGGMHDHRPASSRAREQAIAELQEPAASPWRSARQVQLPDHSTDIYIADTIGELGTLFALAPVVVHGRIAGRARRPEPDRAHRSWCGCSDGTALGELPRFLSRVLMRLDGAQADRDRRTSLAKVVALLMA